MAIFKDYEVRLNIEAPNREAIEEMLEGMPHCDRIFSEKITCEDDVHLEARIRYEQGWNGRGEHYIFENKWSNEEEWGLEVAFPLKDDYLYYTALTKIREWKNLGIPFHFC